MHALVLLTLLADVQGGSMTPTGKGIYPITVPCELSFEDRVKAAKFEFVDPSITGLRFSKGRNATPVNTVMIRFDSQVFSTNEVMAVLKKRGLRPATSDELIEFATRYPNFARQFPLVELGSVWHADDAARVLIVEPHLGGIKLDIEYLDGEWGPNVRFLAVPGSNKNTSRK